MAAAPPSDGVAMAEATVEDPNAEVCRRVQQTGTRFHRRECKTRAEWAEEMQNAQDTTRALQRETAPNDDCLFSNQC